MYYNPMNLNPTSRILLVRTDKIGDVILTTPAIENLRQAYPQAQISYLCRNYTAPILEKNPNLNQIFTMEQPYLLPALKAQKFDAAIYFYVNTESAFLGWRAGIPLRIGPFSKLAALLLNQRIQQNRSRVEKHEAEYNLDLVAALGAKINPCAPKIYLDESEKVKAREKIKSLGIEGQKPIMIHPGSAGSVQTWPVNAFIELSHKLAALNHKIIFTGGRGEEQILEKAKITYHTNIHVIPAGHLSLRELAGVIENSQLLIANSTGPLHIASALNVPTLSFYPQTPIVTSAKRWGPYGNPQKNTILTPTPETATLSEIPVSKALEAAKQILQKN